MELKSMIVDVLLRYALNTISLLPYDNTVKLFENTTGNQELRFLKLIQRFEKETISRQYKTRQKKRMQIGNNSIIIQF